MGLLFIILVKQRKSVYNLIIIIIQEFYLLRAKSIFEKLNHLVKRGCWILIVPKRLSSLK